MRSQASDTAEIRVPVPDGELVGHVGGDGPELLLLHGGPVSNYMEPLADELRDGFRVATYQQRGLEPSTLAEPYDVSTHVADVIAVLDHLGWTRPIIGGHSWVATCCCTCSRRIRTGWRARSSSTPWAASATAASKSSVQR